MELWIRNQDKTMLVKVDYVQRINNVIRSTMMLGLYNSEERAEEVLDEIQNLLYTRVMCRADTTTEEANLLFCKESQGKLIPDTILYAKPINLNSIVYQMPEK